MVLRDGLLARTTWLACAACGLGAFGFFANADDDSATMNEGSMAEERPSTPNDISGPRQPLGFTLDGAEVQKRVKQLLASSEKFGKGEGGASKGHTEASALTPFAKGEPVAFPGAFVSLGDASPAYGIVVEKLHSRLTLYQKNSEGKYDIVKVFHAVTGKNPEDKKTRGDLRTPEGIYFVTGMLQGSSLPKKYGRMALTLDYPNVYDRRESKSGYGIWIHATDDPSRLQRPFDTEGCVAVSNEDVVELSHFAIPFETPIVIVKEMRVADFGEMEQSRQRAMDMVDGWRKAWEASDFETYMSFYSDHFQSLGRSKANWMRFKKELSKRRQGQITVKISQPKILAFEDQLLVVFLQDYTSPERSDFGRKFLYLKWEGDRYRIIAEKWYLTERSEDLVTRVTGSL